MKGGTDPMKDKTSYLTWANVKRIINSCSNDRDRLFFLLAVSTGRRVGELCKLKAQDIDPDSGTIMWNIEKKYREFKVVLPIEDVVLHELLTYIQKEDIPPEGYVFYSTYKEGNRPLSKRQWQYILDKIVLENGIKTAGGEKPHFHCLRHSVAVRILEETGDIRLAKRMLQHSNISITGHYLQVSNRDLREKMDGVLEV